jgi:hypothetical protein
MPIAECCQATSAKPSIFTLAPRVFTTLEPRAVELLLVFEDGRNAMKSFYPVVKISR